jgi:hypothetical protein
MATLIVEPVKRSSMMISFQPRIDVSLQRPPGGAFEITPARGYHAIIHPAAIPPKLIRAERIGVRVVWELVTIPGHHRLVTIGLPDAAASQWRPSLPGA